MLYHGFTGTSAPKSRSNYALFLGDLSIFCTEKDIEDAFQQYGEIVNIRIQRSKETARALSYGFIEFSCETAAVTAMNEMNGFVLKGRPLRFVTVCKPRFRVC
jgi:cold-inducible RNA-binding protein